ncbi:MAG: helix-turn-helix transcriptional regulator, partial [Streptomycetaceae bacterium]|nr:helix-turn-helix transcriptional regulator [Streptomycetaceae bacterium]
ILTAAVTEMGRNATALSGEARTDLGHTAAELLISTLRTAEHGHSPLADRRLSRRTQLLHMRDFVRRHLADPDLSPQTLADAFNVSARYVHAVFAEDGSPPARFIRDTRMAEALRMLADPRQRHRSIASIGYCVGIENPSIFARTFRGHHGVTPREYRHLAETSLSLDEGRKPSS